MSVAERRSVFRRTGYAVIRSIYRGPPGTLPRRRATGGGRTARRSPAAASRPDRDQAAAARDTFEKRRGGLHLDARRPPIRIRAIGLVWMCRDDVPEQDVVLEPELGEHAVDDRRARLRRPGARELALGRERDPGDARPAVPGGFSHQHNRRAFLRRQVDSQPFSPQARTAVLVERVADPGGGEARLPVFPADDVLERLPGELLARAADPRLGRRVADVTTPTISRSSGIPSSSRRRSLSSPTSPKSPAPRPSSTAARSRSIDRLAGVDPPPGDAPLDLLAALVELVRLPVAVVVVVLAHRDDDVHRRARDPRLEPAAPRTPAPARARRSGRASSGSVTTTNRMPWLKPPLGAFRPRATIRSTASRSTGSSV